MTDPWAEKPELVEPDWYDLQGENLPDSDRYYTNRKDYEEAMDAWLEKLKVQMVEEATYANRLIRELKEKAEAE